MKICPLLFACALSSLAIAQTPTAPPPVPATPPGPATPAAPVDAAASPAAPAIVYKEGVIKVGSEMKQTLGTMVDTEKGDNGCYLTLKNEKGIEFIEVAKFEICGQKPPLKGKRVALAFSLEIIQATSCYGDPKCKKTETVPLVVGVKVVE